MKRLLSIIFLLFAMLLGNTIPLLASVTVSFHDVAFTNNNKITLDDIAEIVSDTKINEALRTFIIASSPPLGQEKIFETANIVKKVSSLANTKNIIWTGKKTVTVKRKTIRIDKQQLHNIIIQYLQNHKDELPQGNLNFSSLRAPSEILLPFGEISWKVTPSRPAIVDSSSFSIFFKVNGQPANNCTIRGKIEAIRDVAVSAEKIPRGTILSPAHIVMIPKNVVELKQPIFDPQKIIGMQIHKTLQAGRIFEIKYLHLPPVIKEGEPVKIFAGRGNLRITTNGIARSSGAAGEVIRVKNISSNKLIYARIESPGQVSVEF